MGNISLNNSSSGFLLGISFLNGYSNSVKLIHYEAQRLRAQGTKAQGARHRGTEAMSHFEAGFSGPGFFTDRKYENDLQLPYR